MNIYLDMIGCRLNQSEIETFARQFRLAGHTLVSEAGSADLVVINTCTVTAAAASDSRQMVRHALALGALKVVATGCHATLEPQQFTALSPGVQVIGNADKDHLVPEILNLPAGLFDHAAILREPVPGNRLRTRAFIKVQDGCDNHCTYCITRLARGGGRSRQVQDILLDIRAALEGGCQEIVLTGVHLGSWGHDFEQPSKLNQLIAQVLRDTPTPRLHLSSLEPWDISADFFTLWQDPRLCRHLHLPLQSGCGATLQRMSRRITPQAYAELVREARRTIPGISITTDIITGFPGETEAEFAESLAFVRDMDFAGGHVFTFSPRPGTAAVILPGRVNPVTGKKRNARMREVFKQSSQAFQRQYLDKTVSVLWEKASPMDGDRWQLSGLSDNYLRVHAISPTPCENQITETHLIGFDQNGLLGEILPKSPPAGFN